MSITLYVVSAIQARSSGGERYLDTVEVGGSKPPGPTIKIKGLRDLTIL
jgi:hypothetical protein